MDKKKAMERIDIFSCAMKWLDRQKKNTLFESDDAVGDICEEMYQREFHDAKDVVRFLEKKKRRLINERLRPEWLGSDRED